MLLSLLLVSAVTFAGTPDEKWFYCFKDMHCVKVHDVCGRYKAISASFQKQFAKHVAEKAKTTVCSGDPDPSDKDSYVRQKEEQLMQKNLRPYCLKNVCALH